MVLNLSVILESLWLMWPPDVASNLERFVSHRQTLFSLVRECHHGNETHDLNNNNFDKSLIGQAAMLSSSVMYRVNSKPDHPPPPPPPRTTLGDSHILVVPGIGFSLLCLARSILNQSKSSIILKKSASFALSLNPIRPGLFSRSPGPRGAQRPGCQKSKLTSTD